MADQDTREASSSSNVSDGGSDSIVDLNVKTLDSRIYNFLVDKNSTVSALKEKIASQIGIPVEQQRLIFRGKVLKDEHLLSEYYVESGHTLHLVERQPSQSQPSSGTSTMGTNTNSGSLGQEPSAAGTRSRVGQISHSVVLGTLNVGDQGEGFAPDLSRVIGAVLNSIGIGNQSGGMQPGVQFNAHAPTPQPQGNEREGMRTNAGTQSEAGNQSSPGQTFNGPSLPHIVQIPAGAAIAIPSFNAPIPDSLNTLYEFMTRMEQAFARNDPANQSANIGEALPTVQLPSNHRGLPTPEGLSIILRQVERLIGGRTVAALSHIAGRLEQEAGSTDTTVRGQIQTETVQLGLAMQHLGALFLELGRTILSLRMGRSPAESSVNAGPAVYISPSGPNPIMVQPFPLQTSSLFTSSAFSPSNSGVTGPVGIGNIPRHVNIHIHTGASLTPIVSMVGARGTNGEVSPGERDNSTVSGQTRVFPVSNVIATAIPSQPTVVSVAGGIQPVASLSQSVSASLSSALPEPNSGTRNHVDNMQIDEQSPSDQTGVSSVHQQSVGTGTVTDWTSSGNVTDGTRTNGAQAESQYHQRNSTENIEGPVNANEVPPGGPSVDYHKSVSTSKVNVEEASKSSDSSSATPLGLGLGGLQPKRRGSRQSRAQGKSSDGATTSNQDESRMVGQHVLQSLASHRQSHETLPSGPPRNSAGGLMESITAGLQSADGQLDVADAMSQVLHSPALGGLLAGVSQQTGIGSPDSLRNMMEQLTQNPAMRNTVNQIAQQIDSHDLGSMFSGVATGQGGGFDLSRMIQQMMPIVSQALGGSATVPQTTPSIGPERRQSRARRDIEPEHGYSQIDLQRVARGIEHRRPPQDIFRSMIENVVNSDSGSHGQENVVNELCSEDGLANEFMEMLRQDISRRFEK